MNYRTAIAVSLIVLIAGALALFLGTFVWADLSGVGLNPQAGLEAPTMLAKVFAVGGGIAFAVGVILTLFFLAIGTNYFRTLPAVMRLKNQSLAVKKKFGLLDHKVIATVLITKVLVLVYAYQSFEVVNDSSLGSLYRFFEIWKHWDAEHYLKLAEFGYTNVGEQRFLIVFFPVYPALIALFNLAIGDYLISGFIVTLLASLALGLAFRKLVRLDYSERVSQHAVLFLFIFPTSYFLHIPYTESLFLALVVSCFFAARKRRWVLAACLGFIACLTRINGLILLPALAFEVWEEYRETKTVNREWAWLLLVGVGSLAYLGLNYFVTGDATMFMVYQREHWYKYLRLPVYGIADVVRTTLNNKPEAALMHGFEELLFVLIGLFATVVGWRFLRNSYRVWMAGNWLLFVSTSYVLSVPRYTLIMFPIFILMALSAARSMTLKVLYTVWSILFLGLFATQFVRGWWAF